MSLRQELHEQSFPRQGTSRQKPGGKCRKESHAKEQLPREEDILPQEELTIGQNWGMSLIKSGLLGYGAQASPSFLLTAEIVPGFLTSITEERKILKP